MHRYTKRLNGYIRKEGGRDGEREREKGKNLENGTHKCIRNDTIRRCSLAGGSVSLEEGFEISNVQVKPSVSLFLLPVDPNVELSATSSALCSPAWHHASCCDDNELNL